MKLAKLREKENNIISEDKFQQMKQDLINTHLGIVPKRIVRVLNQKFF
jgi:DNA-directed RNA polymerase specialized sigma subunit